MLRYELIREESILIVSPEDPLEVQDFVALNRDIDPFIAETGTLKGLMIYSESFPGWETFAAFLSHLRFVKNHQQQINKVAAVTDSGFLFILPRVASHFIQAKIKHFPYGDKEIAIDWLKY